MDVIYKGVLYLVPMILSLTVHEYAHAWAAKRLGDDTAERLGRLNLNPLSHIDPIGSVLMPMMLIAMAGGPFFAWAKPVPVEPSRFRRDITARNGMMLTAFAGPLSNFLLLIGCALVLAGSQRFHPLPEAIVRLLVVMMTMNAGLFLFNMVPVFPLDGQKVLSGLLPRQLAERYDAVNYQFGSFLLIPLFLVGGRFLAGPVQALVHSIATLTGLA